jgi:hypothetical protein
MKRKGQNSEVHTLIEKTTARWTNEGKKLERRGGQMKGKD